MASPVPYRYHKNEVEPRLFNHWLATLRLSLSHSPAPKDAGHSEHLEAEVRAEVRAAAGTVPLFSGLVVAQEKSQELFLFHIPPTE